MSDSQRTEMRSLLTIALGLQSRPLPLLGSSEQERSQSPEPVEDRVISLEESGVYARDRLEMITLAGN